MTSHLCHCVHCVHCVHVSAYINALIDIFSMNPNTRGQRWAAFRGQRSLDVDMELKMAGGRILAR